ncbi:MAG: sulfite exporter TauE/SafE family protein [Gammaproteobacteria bacterium]
MPIDATFLSAFIVGMLGGVHCVGMCGGIVSMLTLGVPEAQRKGVAAWRFVLAYNLARIWSYTIAGALMGGLGWLAAYWPEIRQLQLALQLLSGLFMIALGLYLAGWWYGLLRVEAVGVHFWKKIEPYTRKFIPVRSVSQAFSLGFLWGWLPCGLVYSVLVWSISAANPLNGGLLMMSFGLGTLPVMIGMGLFAGKVSNQWVQSKTTRQIAGGLVILLGVVQLLHVFTAYRTAV